MRQMIIIAALAIGAGMAAWSDRAHAQSVEFYVGPSATYDRYYDYPAYGGYYYAPPAYSYDYRRGGYYERPSNYRYGTKRWWEQMDRNGRGGHQK